MIAALVCSGLANARSAAAERCATADVKPSSTQAELAYSEGRDYAVQGRYAEARGIYAWLLKIDPGDRDALIAFARLDAWDGCYERAEGEYRALVAERPHDIEARAGLIDIMIWSARRDEAAALIEQGLALDPNAAELLRRRAQVLAIQGHRQRALAAAELAERYQPGDPDILAIRDRLYLSQLRASTRFDIYDKHYLPNIYTETLEISHFIDRFELAANALMQTRVGGTLELSPMNQGATPPPAPTIIDGLYSVTASYHMNGGAVVGVGSSFGAPAKTVPRFIEKAWAGFPIGSQLSIYLSYAFWFYPTYDDYPYHKQAHILAPVVDFNVLDNLTIEARYYASYLVLPQPDAPAQLRLVHAGGGRVLWRPKAQLMVGAGGTYGEQLDQTHPGSNPDLPAGSASFLPIKSYIVTAFGDIALRRGLGLTPVLAFEHRLSPHVANVYSTELGAYLRW